MTPASQAEELVPTGRPVESRRQLFLRFHLVSAAIWMLLTAIFLADILTPPDNISVCFAYAIPIFVSLFEARPRPFLYAGIATGLSLFGTFVLPPSVASTTVIIADRLIAIVTQWLAAMLVGLQQRRLAEMRDEAEFQRRFVNILSHEVGNALTTVTGQAYRLSKLSEQLTPSDLQLRAEKIRTAAERIEAIIQRVQFASHLGDGTIPIGHESIDLHALLLKLVEQLKEEHPEASIGVDRCLSPRTVNGDEMLLSLVFENVILNSIKYSSEAPIRIRVGGDGSTCRVAVTDAGSGIDKYDLPRVRFPYYRGQNSKGTSGAGLGLYLVERIVEAHRGNVTINSEMGKGTEVVIELPNRADPTAA
jgi:signal transduction histidine kinase